MTLRTSRTHPLQIPAVSVGAGMGRVGVTFCPGKCQQVSATGGWDRDLALDVAAIAEWGAAAVLTLIEAHELDALGVSDLGRAVAERQMAWWHLPIHDVSVPGAVFETAWERVGPQLCSLLRSGFDVLVHCKGGLGRAGTIACRLLVDAGWTAEGALAAVRDVRPGAVETAAQERYVAALVPLPEVMPVRSRAAIEDRARGALLGLAVGDALGTTLEFSRRDTKPLLTDMVGGGPFKLRAGQWTDDTAMALALADSLAAHPRLDPHDLMRRFVAWHRDGDYSCTGRCFDIGVTTRQALARFERDGDPLAGSTDAMTAGNGSLMRLAPVAIRHDGDAEGRRAAAALQSRTTHAAPEAVAACIIFADMLADAITGVPRDEVLLAPRATALSTVTRIVNGSWKGMPRHEIVSSGYVLHSLEAAL